MRKYEQSRLQDSPAHACRRQPRPVVLNHFCISYPFIKQDYQICPNTLNGAILLKILVKKLLLFRMIYKKLALLQFRVL